MSRTEKCMLTNMCMVYDDRGHVLVQNRTDAEWGGISFPGGHVEKNESFIESVIREIKEETGLSIKSPKLCGVKQWPHHDGSRYIVLFYKTNKFSGTLKSSDEGEVFWVPLNEMKTLKLADDFDDMLDIFLSDELQEFQWIKENGGWKKRIL